MLNKKRLFGGFASMMMLLAMGLAACGGSSTTGTSTANITYSGTITIWHNWQGDYVQYKQSIMDAYTKLHPNVTFKLVNQSDDTKTTQAVNAGSGPDIVVAPIDHIGTLASAGVIIPLDQYISQSYLTSTYTAPAAKGATFKSHVYGVPEVSEIVTMMYNKSMVTADQLPKTTDDMLNFEKTFIAANPGKYGVVWTPVDAYYNAGFFYGFGAQLIDDTGKSTIGSPQGIAAAKYIQQFAQYLPKDLDGTSASALFNGGKAAAIIDGPWAYSGYAKAIGTSNVGFAVLPTVNSTNQPIAPFVGGKAMMVTKNASNVALDVDFMKFYTNAANQETMVSSTGEIPANLAAGSSSAVTGNPVIAAFFAQSKNGVPFPNTPYMSAVWTPLGKALTVSWQGTLAPDTAMTQAQQGIDAGVAKLNGQ